MSKKKFVIAAAGALLVAGGAAAVSAPGHRGGWHDGASMMQGDDAVFPASRRFGREFTKEQFDRRTRERFAGFDKNGDNVIDKSEFEVAINERMSQRFGQRGAGRGEGRGSDRALRAFDANRDGKLTKDEVRSEYQRRFAEADINSDGKLDDADLPPLMRGRVATDKSGFGMRHARRGIGSLAEADSNKDGVVTKEEVDVIADIVFVRWDWNKDGVIDQADRDFLRKEMIDYRAQKMAHLMGGGSDGSVTREQYKTKANERFGRLDLNGDGKITRDELPGRRHGKAGWSHGFGSHDGGSDNPRADRAGQEGSGRAAGRDGTPPTKD